MCIRDRPQVITQNDPALVAEVKHLRKSVETLMAEGNGNTSTLIVEAKKSNKPDKFPSAGISPV